MLDNVPNRPSKFRTKNWVEIKDESGGTYNTIAQNKFKKTMLKSILCHYSETGNITVNNTASADADANNTNKKGTFENCAPFTDFVIEIKNKQKDNARHIHMVNPMYNVIEHSDNYSKIPESLCQYYKDIPTVNDDGDIIGFNGTNATDS